MFYNEINLVVPFLCCTFAVSKPMDMKIVLGTKIRVTLPKWEGYISEYKVIETNIKGDGRGSIRLETLSHLKPNQCPEYFQGGLNTIVVEELWFNVPKYRKVEIIK